MRHHKIFQISFLHDGPMFHKSDVFQSSGSPLADSGGPEQNCTALADLKKKCPDYNEFRNSLCKASGQRIRFPYSGISIDNPLKDRLQFIMQ